MNKMLCSEIVAYILKLELGLYICLQDKESCLD